MELAIIVALVVLTASSGSVFKPGEWYRKLRKPGWTPPNWAFPVVWTILYVMIGYSGWLTWSAGGWSIAMALWGVQLVLNAGWSFLFFGRRRMDLAFGDVLVLLATILLYIAFAWPVSTLAALLFVPYAAWVATAATLNFSVWRLNASGARA